MSSIWPTLLSCSNIPRTQVRMNQPAMEIRQPDRGHKNASMNSAWIEVQRRHPQRSEDTFPEPKSLDFGHIVGFVLQHGRNEPWDGISMIKMNLTCADYTKCTTYQKPPKQQFHDNDMNGNRDQNPARVSSYSIDVGVGSQRRSEELILAKDKEKSVGKEG